MTNRTMTDARKTHVGLVFAIAFSDGDLDEMEKKWAMAVALQLGLTADELVEAATTPLDSEAISRLTRDERKDIMVDCFYCAYADGVLDDSEKRLLVLTAEVLGFTLDEAIEMFTAEVTK